MKIEKNYIIGLGVLTVIAAILAYYFGARTGKASTAIASEAGNANSEVKRGNLTYQPSTYNALSNKLYEALSGILTDEQSVYSVFTQMKNHDDILELIKDFGSRGVWPFKGTLSEWLYQSLSSSEIAQVNEILARNGNTYKF